GLARYVCNTRRWRAVCLYTDSWEMAQGLATWMGRWRAQDWAIHGNPVWDAPIWQELYSAAQDLLIYVFHVDAHQNRTQEHYWNAAMDQLAHIAECTAAPADEGEAFSLLASWIHTHSAHLGPEGAYCWAQARGIPTSQVALKTAKAVCKICQIVKPLQVEAGSHRQVPRGDQPTQIWQVDYVGPLPHDHRKANILTMVDTSCLTALGMIPVFS
uniref:RNase H type-1 domain-containing protein n=1 Tax=Terrapene triunguis TaxID=2587831 RepID=A0A674K3P7_9SAUR